MKIIKKLFFNTYLAKYFLPVALWLEGKLYKAISRLAVLANNGVHPKHRITKYQEWFADHLSKDWSVYEVGSHTGAMTKTIGQNVARVLAIEIIPELVEIAKKRNSLDNVEFITGDATKFQLESPVDCIVLSNVLEHIDQRVAFLKGLLTNTNWNGEKRLLIRVPLITRDWISCYKKELGIDYRRDPTHFTEYTEKEITEELNQANIQIHNFDKRFGEAFLVCEGH